MTAFTLLLLSWMARTTVPKGEAYTPMVTMQHMALLVGLGGWVGKWVGKWMGGWKRGEKNESCEMRWTYPRRALVVASSGDGKMKQ